MNSELNERAYQLVKILVEDQNKKMPWIAERLGVNTSRIKSIRYKKSYQATSTEVEALERLTKEAPSVDPLTKQEKALLSQMQKENETLTDIITRLMKDAEKNQETIDRLLRIIERGFE